MSRTTYSYSRSSLPTRRGKKSNFKALILLTIAVFAVYMISIEIHPKSQLVSETINEKTADINSTEKVD
ncbi:MAG: hypothetical protein ACHP6I_01220 [Rickettsiales bacterium]